VSAELCARTTLTSAYADAGIRVRLICTIALGPSVHSAMTAYGTGRNMVWRSCLPQYSASLPYIPSLAYPFLGISLPWHIPSLAYPFLGISLPWHIPSLGPVPDQAAQVLGRHRRGSPRRTAGRMASAASGMASSLNP
jgi:hypothetical protein